MKKIIAEKGAPADKANPAKLFLRFESKDQRLMDQVLKLLKANHGDIPVYFYFADSQKIFEAGRSYFIGRNSRLEQDLNFLVGKENVKWQ
jgi:hypothetical protein